MKQILIRMDKSINGVKHLILNLTQNVIETIRGTAAILDKTPSLYHEYSGSFMAHENEIQFIKEPLDCIYGGQAAFFIRGTNHSYDVNEFGNLAKIRNIRGVTFTIKNFDLVPFICFNGCDSHGNIYKSGYINLNFLMGETEECKFYYQK